MGRYFKSLRRFWGTALASQLEYQLNVVIELIAVGLSLLGSLFMLSLFFGPGRELGGWSWHEALISGLLYGSRWDGEHLATPQPVFDRDPRARRHP